MYTVGKNKSKYAFGEGGLGGFEPPQDVQVNCPKL